MTISNNIASLQANQTFMNTNANNIANDGSQKSQTNLAKEIPNQVTIAGIEKANVTAIKAQDDVMGTLLDIKA